MATISWISSSGGDWSLGANWQGGVVPGAGDDAVMNLVAGETITVSTTQDVHSIAMTDTAATFVIAGAGTLDVSGNVTLNFGSISMEGAISAGGTIGLVSQGTLLITGQLSGAAIEASAGAIPDLPVVTIGTATAVITDSNAVGPLSGFSVTSDGNGGTSVAVTVACFAAGTRIATPDGEQTVEALQAGDLICLAGGNTAPISWLAHRHIDFIRCPELAAVFPVRIRRGAFADDVPHRDLILSPDHAVYVDGVLIPVRYLVDGCSIVQEAWDRVSYFHIELAGHDVVLAEGLAVESYLETGGRGNFANGGAAVRLFPDFALPDAGFVSHIWEAKGCAPLVVTGPVVQRVRRALRQRSRAQTAPANEPPRKRRRAS